MTNFIGEAPRFRLAVAHGAAEEEAKAMMERLKAAFPQAEEIYFGTISPGISCSYRTRTFRCWYTVIK